ncbi:MAG: RagB/SusD family nutrient uptake outer membrane protein [Tannerella sp.]|jgi:tetratricopeptide (TPR) repeat protein|nr:RagB/SusD family nutrient uptake outer membrane protein [Tannerella sp.]
MKYLLKNIAIILVASVMVFGTSGCNDDLLDLTPSYSFSSANVWASPILARAAVNGVYNTLYQRFAQDYTSGCLGIPSDAYSQVMDIDANWKGNCIISPGNATPSTTNIATHYKYYYTIVYRANDVINNIDNVPEMKDDEKAQLKAEAKFLRAWAYYNLNVLWRGVPVYTENVEPNDATNARSSEAEVWNLIITDLTEAIPSLPDKVSGGGRASKGSAYAFRGIAYQWTGEYAKALSDFETVGNLGYALFSPNNGAAGNDDFFQLFKPANEQCAEMIFAVECVEQTNMGNPRGINYGNRVTGGSAWNNYLPNPAFVERYENADGSKFDWEQYLPGYKSMAPKERSVYFLRDGLVSGNGEFGAYDYKDKYNQMVEFGSDMTKYIDQGNEARIREVYERRDPRLMQAIITPYSTYDGNEAGIGNHTWTLRWPYCLDAGEPYDIRTDTNSMFYYLWRKYVTENDECTTRWVYSENIILCRYAEILLRRAECLNELGRTSEAITFIDMVRHRAGHIQLSDPACKTAHGTQAELRELIRNEMYVELGGEDVMYYNELRWGTWYDLKYRDNTCGQVGDMNTNGLMEIWGILKYNHVSVGEHIKIWPIPAKEREMNPNLVQNPGWKD